MKKFDKLPIEEQKMQIVRDAIAQIQAGKITVRSGIYLRVNDNGEGKKLKRSENLKDSMKKRTFKCEGCAKGAIFAACVLEVNDVYGKDKYQDESFQSSKLRPWFSKKEIDLIEYTFEGWSNERSESYRFFRRYKDPKERLLAILNNILENGKFLPSVRRKVAKKR